MGSSIGRILESDVYVDIYLYKPVNLTPDIIQPYDKFQIFGKYVQNGGIEGKDDVELGKHELIGILKLPTENFYNFISNVNAFVSISTNLMSGKKLSYSDPPTGSNYFKTVNVKQDDQTGTDYYLMILDNNKKIRIEIKSVYSYRDTGTSTPLGESFSYRQSSEIIMNFLYRYGPAIS